MLAMAAIILPLHFFPFPFTRETKLCSYYTGSFLSYLKATTEKVLSRIARTPDSIISNMKIFQCVLNIDACYLSKRALKAETEIYISYW